MRLLLAALCTVLLGAKEKPPAGPPAVPVEMRSEAWQKQNEVNATQLNAEHSDAYRANQSARQEWDAFVVRWKAFCGEQYQPGMDSSHQPACVEKPKPPQAKAPTAEAPKAAPKQVP